MKSLDTINLLYLHGLRQLNIHLNVGQGCNMGGIENNLEGQGYLILNLV